MDDNANNLRRVGGEILIDVNEITNSGNFRAELQLPGGTTTGWNWSAFTNFLSCQDGGIAAFLFETWQRRAAVTPIGPRAWLYVAGWGYLWDCLAQWRDGFMKIRYEIHYHGDPRHARSQNTGSKTVTRQ